MQKFSALSLVVSLSLVFSASLHGSTVWKFDYKTIAGHIEDEIDKRFQPGLQSEAMKSEIAFFKAEKKAALVRAVEQEHYRNPFKTEQQAKEYASELTKLESNDFFNKIVSDRVAMKMVNFPSRAAVFKDYFSAVAKTYIGNKALQEAERTGRLTQTLKNIDSLIKEALKTNSDGACDACSWLRNQ